MLKKELLELVKGVEDDKEVDKVLKGTDLYKSMLSLDNFKDLVATNKDFKSYMDSEKDKYNAKALETWKANNLEKLIDEKVKELHPEEDPKDTELAKLKREMENMKKEKTKEQLTNKALKIATEKDLPTDLVDYFIGQDEESTNKNLETLEKVFTEKLQATVKERLKDNSYTPPKNDDNKGSNTYSNLVKNADNMTSEQIAEQFAKLDK